MQTDQSECVAIIPARGGSKAIPRKNLADLGGRPLLAWSVSASLRAGIRTFVSSDDGEILETARTWGAETLQRPAELGHDSVHAVHVVLDSIRQLEEQDSDLSTVIMLLPTSPFRQPTDIEKAVELFRQHSPPAVISVQRMGKQLIHLREMDAGKRLLPLVAWGNLTSQRQDQPPLYGLNGSVYVSSANNLKQKRTFHVEGALGSEMNGTSSVDINEPEELEYARHLVSTGKVSFHA